MKNQLLKLKYYDTFLMISFMMTLFIHCRTEETVPISKYYLTEEQKKNIPYKEGDNIRFKNSMGDTLIFRFNGCKIISKVEQGAGSEPPKYVYEFYTCNMTDKNNFCFEFYLSAFSGYYIDFGKKYDNEFYGISGFIGVNLDGDTIKLKNDSLFLSSYKIENKTFNNIYVSMPSVNRSYENNIKKLFFNKQFGIIRIEFKFGNYWSLFEN